MGKWRDSWTDAQKHRFYRDKILNGNGFVDPLDAQAAFRFMERHPNLLASAQDQSPEVGELGSWDFEPDEQDAYSPDPAVEFLQEKGRGFFKAPDLKTYSNPTREKRTGFFQRLGRRAGITPGPGSARELPQEHISDSFARYNPNSFKYGESRVYLDLETVGTDTQKGSILSYAAIRMAHNLDTGNWDLVDKRTRYYYPTSEDRLLKNAQGEYVYDQSVAISGLTDENIKSRRSAQAARYSKHFNDKERERLLNYIGNDTVVGHNISQFDWPKLYGLHTYAGFELPDRYLPKGGLIDTLHIAEGTRGDASGLNNLSTLFSLATGETPEQAGFTAHDALEDIQMLHIVDKAMQRDDGRMGVVSRYLLHHKGLSSQWRDSMINGITEIRGMTTQQLDVLNSITGDPDSNINDFLEEDIARTTFGGHEASRQASLNTLGAVDISANFMDVANAIKTLTQDMRTYHESQVGINNNSLVAQAAKFATDEEREEFLRNSPGFANASSEVMQYAVHRAGMLYNQAHYGSATAPEKAWQNFEANINAGGWKLSGRPDTVGGYAGTSDLLSTTAKLAIGFKKLGESTERILKAWNSGNIKWSNPDALWKAAGSEYNDLVNDTAFLAGPFQGAYKRFGKSIYEHGDYLYNNMRSHSRWWGYLGGGVAGLLGTAIGSPGLGAAAFVTGQHLTDTALNSGQDKIRAIGSEFISRANLWGGVYDLITTPLKLFANGLKISIRGLTQFGKLLTNIWSGYRNLGIPLTMANTIGWAGMQQSYTADAMIGQRDGTIHGAITQFGGAQQDLFTLGQLDRTRVVAAALTGTFNSVYANGGDTDSQYAATINTIARRMANASPREQQRLMNLAGKIDPTMPTALQQMKNIGVTDYNSILNGSWLKGRNVHFYAGNDQRRAAYSVAGMEWGASVTSMKESVNNIGLKLWNWIGKDIANGVNDFLYMLSEGQWKNALQYLKSKASDIWAKIAGTLFGDEGISFGAVWSKIRGVISSGIELLAPHVLKAFGTIGSEILNLMADISDKMWPMFSDFIARLAMTRIGLTFDWEKRELGFKVTGPTTKETGGDLSIKSWGKTKINNENSFVQGMGGLDKLEGYIDIENSDGTVSRIPFSRIQSKRKDLDYVRRLHEQLANAENTTVNTGSFLGSWSGQRAGLDFINGIGNYMLQLGGNQPDLDTMKRHIQFFSDLPGLGASLFGTENMAGNALRFSAGQLLKATQDSSKYYSNNQPVVFQLGRDETIEVQADLSSLKMSESLQRRLSNYTGLVKGKITELGAQGAQ